MGPQVRKFSSYRSEICEIKRVSWNCRDDDDVGEIFIMTKIIFTNFGIIVRVFFYFLRTILEKVV